MWLKKSASRNLSVAATVVAMMSAVTGCGKKPPAAKADQKPERVYISVSELERAHPLALTVRQLEQQAQMLQREKIPPALATASPLTDSPLSSGSGTRVTDAARNQAARRALFRSALVTLGRYDNAIQTTLQRIREAERDQLEGIARANSAAKEAEERTQLEDAAYALLRNPDRADQERLAQMRRNAARINLRDGNVITLARDPKTQLPDKEALNAQIAQLRARETTEEAQPETPQPPLVVSDEARITKVLQDQQAILTRIRTENNATLAQLEKDIAALIATTEANNLKWVEEQLALSPRGAQNKAQLAALRTQLTTLIGKLNQTTSLSALPAIRPIPPAPAALPAVVINRPVQTAILQRLAKERGDLQATIRRDVTNAVRDAALAHHVEPVFSPAYNIPNKTVDFRTWIFGNVPENALSKNTK